MCESEEGGLVPFEASSPISIHLFLILSPDDNEGGDDEAAKTLRLRRRRRGRASGESPCCHRRRAGRIKRAGARSAFVSALVCSLGNDGKGQKGREENPQQVSLVPSFVLQPPSGVRFSRMLC